MNYLETADGNRVVVGPDGRVLRGPFPRHWGQPPDDLKEIERWAARNIVQGDQRMDRGEPVPGQRPRTGRQALAYLQRKRESPVFANAARLRLVELLERGPM